VATSHDVHKVSYFSVLAQWFDAALSHNGLVFKGIGHWRESCVCETAKKGPSMWYRFPKGFKATNGIFLPNAHIHLILQLFMKQYSGLHQPR